MSSLQRLKSGYKSAGIILLNFGCLIVLANLGLGAFYWIKDGARSSAISAAAGCAFREDGAPAGTDRRTPTQLAWADFGAYEGIEAQYVCQVLSDFYDLEQLGFVYQSWVQFAEPPFSGWRVSVDLDERRLPIRRTINYDDDGSGPDRVVRIFIFGGSTTFGYHVSDEHTWPSFLSRILNGRAHSEGQSFRIEVFNYGRGYYGPSQETVLLADLLKQGHRPSLAIFMDGVNWGSMKDEPQFKPQMARAFIASQHGRDIPVADLFAEFRWIPMVRLAWSTNKWLDSRLADAGDAEGVLSGYDWEKRVEVSMNQFQQSGRIAQAICELYGCRTLFFLQPNPLYRYNLELYRRELPETFSSALPGTAALYEALRQSQEYVDLSDLFEAWGVNRKAIVDDLHYSPGFNEFLAERVAGYIEFDSLAVNAEVIDESAATGALRSLVTKEGWLKPPVERESMGVR